VEVVVVQILEDTVELYKTVADEAHVQNYLPTSFLAMVTQATTLLI
jgi:hypothetical protein